MRFNMADLNPAVWVDIDEGRPEEGALCLRVLNGKKLEALRKKHLKKVQKRGVITEELDAEAYDREMWDYCIHDWKGIEDADGTPIPCTAENKLKLMSESPEFCKLVSGLLNDLEAIKAKRDEDAEKN